MQRESVVIVPFVFLYLWPCLARVPAFECSHRQTPSGRLNNRDTRTHSDTARGCIWCLGKPAAERNPMNEQRLQVLRKNAQGRGIPSERR